MLLLRMQLPLFGLAGRVRANWPPLATVLPLLVWLCARDAQLRPLLLWLYAKGAQLLLHQSCWG